MYRVQILPAAIHDLDRLDEQNARRIVVRIQWPASNIEAIRPEALTGDLAGLFKLRAGDYRIIYEIKSEEQVILIYAIGHRREIYRRR